MSGISIIGGTALKIKLKKYEAFMLNPRDALREVGKAVVSYNRKNMLDEGKSLNKTRWKALSPATVAQKVAKGYGNKRILERNGYLRGQHTILKESRNSVTVGNKASFYKYHQLGGKNLPQRRMVGINESINKLVLEIFVKHLKKI